MPYIKTAGGSGVRNVYSYLFHHMFVVVNVLADFPFELDNQISENSQGVKDEFLSSEL